MFGRTGQMFPRRAYHDAMYEEEYGSETTDDCCRGRGLSGILCWLFSVILLIGLATSLILTVFFVLKSRNLIGGSGGSGGGGMFDDLDIFNGYTYNRNKIDKVNENNNSSLPTMTTTDITHLDFDFTLSKEEAFEHKPFLPIMTKISTMTSTILPPMTHHTHRFYGPTTQKSTTTTTTQLPLFTSRPTKVTTTTTTQETMHDPIIITPFEQPKTNGPFQNFPNQITKERFLEQFPEAEGSSNKSGHRDTEIHKWNPIPTTTSRGSSSEENLSSTTHAHVLFSLPPSSQINVVQKRRPNRGPPITSFSTSTEKDTEILFPDLHDQNNQSLTTEIESSTSIITPQEPESNPTRRHDLLERIIKNLAPKFKNKTEIFSSHDPVVPLNSNYRIKTVVRTSTPPPEVSSESSEEIEPNFPSEQEENHEKLAEVMEEVEPPKLDVLNPRSSSTESSTSDNNNFMNILVGDNDTKRLITKETDAGIITSAILPPWFVNNTERESSSVTSIYSAENRTVSSNSTESNPVDEEDDNGQRSTTSPSIFQQIRPGIGQMFMNMFNSDLHSQHKQQQPNRIGSVSRYGARPPSQPISSVDTPKEEASESKRVTSFKDLLKELSPVFPKSISPASTLPNSGMLHYGHQNMYGHPQKPQHHHHDQSFHDPDEAENISVDEEEKSQSAPPSHIVEIAYNQNQRPEIIIEPEVLHSTHEQDYDSSHPQEPMNAASAYHPQIISPPSEFQNEEFKVENVSSELNLTQLSNISTTEGSRSKIIESIITDVRNKPSATYVEVNPFKFKQDHPSHESQSQLQGNINKFRDDLKRKFEKTEIDRTYERETENETGEELRSENSEEEMFSEEGVKIFEKIPITGTDEDRKTQNSNDDDNTDRDHENYFIQRQPVNQLDETLYRQSQLLPPSTTQSESSNEKNRPKSDMNSTIKGNDHVYEVYPTRYSTTTTSTTLPPPLPMTSPESQRNISGFYPPEPINFHSNPYNFKPSVSSSANGFVPIVSDTWRPVLYDGDENQASKHENSNRFPVNAAPNSRPNSQTSFQNPKDNNREYGVTTGGGSIMPSFSEALKLRPITTGSSNFDQNAESSSHWTNVFHVRTTKPPIIPSQPIPPQVVSNLFKFPPTSPEGLTQMNAMIDRSKYMHRPAPPPILMRRNPQDSRPNRRKQEFRVPPYLTQHQQIQQQRMLKERLYQQQLAKLRERGEGGGNVQWPNEQPIRRNG